MTTFNEHDHPRSGAGKFTEKPQTGDIITLAGEPSAQETAADLTIDVVHRLEDVHDSLDSGDPTKIATAYEAMRRADAAMEKARSELARAHIGQTIRKVYPTATTLEVSNWGSSSEPSFAATGVRAADGTVLWNSDHRGPGEASPEWTTDITFAMYDIGENTITVEPDTFRDYARNAIRLV